MDVFISFRAEATEASIPLVAALEKQVQRYGKWIVCLRLYDLLRSGSDDFPTDFIASEASFRASCIAAFVDLGPVHELVGLLEKSFSTALLFSEPEPTIRCRGAFSFPYPKDDLWQVDFKGNLIEERIGIGKYTSSSFIKSRIKLARSQPRGVAKPLRSGSSYRADAHQKHAPTTPSAVVTNGRISKFAQSLPEIKSFSRQYCSIATKPGLPSDVHHQIKGALWKTWEVFVVPGVIRRNNSTTAKRVSISKSYRIEKGRIPDCSIEVRSNTAMDPGKSNAQWSASPDNLPPDDEPPPSYDSDRQPDDGDAVPEQDDKIVPFPLVSKFEPAPSPESEREDDIADLRWARSVSMTTFGANMRRYFERTRPFLTPVPPRKRDETQR